MKELFKKLILISIITIFLVIFFNINCFAISTEINSLSPEKVTIKSIQELPVYFLEANEINKTAEEDAKLSEAENNQIEDDEPIEEDVEIEENENNMPELGKDFEINQEYIEWQNTPEEERKEKWGDYIPPQIITKIKVDEEKNQSEPSIALCSATSLESSISEKSYNLKSKININVENQQQSGWCWNYTSLKCLQTYFQKRSKNYNFAEYHLGYMRYKSFGGWLNIDKGSYGNYGEAAFKNGGNFDVFQRYAGIPSWGQEEKKWMTTKDLTTKGPIVGEDTQNKIYLFNTDNFNSFKNKKPTVKVLRTVNFASISKTYSNGKVSGYKNGSATINSSDVKTFRNKVKSQIKNNGAVYTSTNIDENYFNKNKNALYINNNSIGSNHAVTIVGWDDNYSKTNFKTQPINNGAWIALNSWGSSWGNGGYFYISYDDALVEKNINGVIAADIWDKEPEVTIKYSTTSKTNGNVTVTIDSFNKIINPPSGWTLNYTNWDMSEKFYTVYTKKSRLTKTFTANETKSIKIYDESGKYVNKTIGVSNIDKTNPKISSVDAKLPDGSTYTFGQWTNKDVTLTVTASDANKIKEYSFNGGTSWQTSNKYTITSTHKVNIKVRDTVGNVSTVYKQVNIDKQNPSITGVSKSPSTTWANKDVVVTVNAKDNGESGISAYSFNGGAWQTSNKCTIKNTQNVSVKVKDKAGNQVTKNIQVNIDRDVPKIVISGNEGLEGKQWVNASKIGNPQDGGAYIVISMDDGERSSGRDPGYYYKKEGSNSWTKSTTIDHTGSNAHYYITQNETVYFKIMDKAGNYSQEFPVVINKVDKINPKITSVKQTLSQDKKTVTLIVNAEDAQDSKGIASGIKEYSFDGGKTWSSKNQTILKDNQTIDNNMIIVKDAAGNETKYNKQVKIVGIDKIELEVNDPTYSNKGITNKNVVVTITANKKIKTPSEASGWKLSDEDEEGKTITKEYTENTQDNGEDVVVTDQNTGISITKNVKVLNIDKTPPVVNTENIKYERTEKDTMKVTVKANEKLQAITDATKGLKNKWKIVDKDPCAISTEFSTSQKGEIQIKDLAGNIKKVHIEFTLRDSVIDASISYKTKEKEIEEGEITNKPITVTIIADRPVKTIDGWALSSDKKTLTKTYEEYEEETIVLKDDDNNTLSIPLKANIDKQTPTITSITGNPTKWTNKSVTITVKAQDTGSSETIEYSFDGGNTWSSTNKKVYNANTEQIQIAVRDSAGNVSTYSKKIDITKIDKESPKILNVTQTLSQDKRIVTLVVQAEDSKSGIKEYSFDGGINWTSENSIDYYNNESIQANMIKVRDNVGNEYTYNNAIIITGIDETKLKVNKIDYSNKEVTNENVIVKITANKRLEQPSETSGWKLFEEDEEGKTIIKEYKKNTLSTGEYVTLTDANTGTTLKQKVTVLNIDKSYPKLLGEINKSSTEYYVKSVIVSMPDIEDEGVAGFRDDGLTYSYDEGQTWVSDDNYEYESNGNKSIYIRDSANNILRLSVEIDNIDSVSPTIDSVTGYTNNQYVKDSVTLTINAHDDKELDEYAYSFDGGDTYQKNNTKAYTYSTSDIAIVVRDKAGQTTEYGEKINLKIDDTYPNIVDVTGIPTEWSKKVTLTVNATDEESGINGYSFSGQTYKNQNTYDVTQNGTVSIKVKDCVGHITSKSVTINKIDNTAPAITGMLQEVSEDNMIILTVQANDPKDKKGIASKIKEYSFDGGLTWTTDNSAEYEPNTVIHANTIRVRDNAGNELIYDKDVNIQYIDTTELQASEPIYSIEKITNKNVVVKIVANKKVKTPSEESGWILSDEDEEGKTITKEYTENTLESGEDVVITDQSTGKSIIKNVKVLNIDKISPVVNPEDIKYEQTEDNTMKVTVKANEELQSITDTTKGLKNKWKVVDEDPCAISTEFSATQNGEIQIKDLAGNIKKVHIEFILRDPLIGTQISYKTEDNEIAEGEITNKPITVTIKADRVIKEIEGWTLSDDRTILTKTYEEYKEETIIIEDDYSNTLSIPIKANIDTEAPTITSITGNPTKWTNKNVTLTVKAQDTGSSQRIQYSFDGGVNWSSSNKKAYSENTKQIQIAVRDSAGNITMNLEKIDITKIDKEAPKILDVSKNEQHWTREVILTVNAEDNESGIVGYSFDDTNVIPRPTTLTYISKNIYNISKNTVISIKAKDAAGNESQEKVIGIYNIDNVAPTIHSVEATLSEDTKNIEVTVNAGDNETGIDAYTFDGGDTWISSLEVEANKKIYSRNGLVESGRIGVRDGVGNETYYDGDVDLTIRVASISIKQMPYTTIYEKNTLPDLEGGIISVTYDDGFERDIEMKDNVQITGYNNRKLGEQEITLTYDGKKVKMKIKYISSLKSISLDTTEKILEEGKNLKLYVTYNPEDTTDDKTITWTSSNNDVAIVDSEGNITALEEGQAVITATTQNGLTATCNIEVIGVVTQIELTKNPIKTIYEKGEELDLEGGKITVIYETGKKKELDLTDSRIHIIGYDKTKLGEQVLTVEYVGKTTTIKVNVKCSLRSIYLDNSVAQIYKGESFVFNVIYNPEDTTDDKTITWTTSDDKVVSVDANGRVTGLDSGTATITAKTTNGKQATYELEVIKIISGIEVTTIPKQIVYEKGEKLKLYGGKITVTYVDGETEEIDLTYVKVKVTGYDNTKLGEQELTVEYEGKTTTMKVYVESTLRSISLNKTVNEIHKGESFVLKAIYNPEDTTDDKTIIWTTSNNEVATVDTEGKVTAVDVGTATITATALNGIRATCEVEVSNKLGSIEVTTIPTKVVYEKGEELDLAGGKITVTYENGETKEIDLTDEKVKVTGYDNTKLGEQYLTVEYEGKTTTIKVLVKSTLSSISLDKTVNKIHKGENFVLKVSYNPEDTTDDKRITWTTSNDKVLSVDADGEVTALDVGTATITAIASNGLQATCEVEVTNNLTAIQIKIEPNKTSYIEGESFDKTGMEVIAIYEDGSYKTIEDYIVIDGDNLIEGKTNVTIMYTEDGVTKETQQSIIVTTVEEKLQVKISKYDEIQKDGKNYIENIRESTIKNVLEQIETNGTVEIYQGEEKIEDINKKIATGMTLKFSLKDEYKEYTIVVIGDLNGDGEMGDIDVLKLSRYKAGLDTNLEGAYKQAANIYKDDKYGDDIDLLKMIRVLVGLDTL